MRFDASRDDTAWSVSRPNVAIPGVDRRRCAIPRPARKVLDGGPRDEPLLAGKARIAMRLAHEKSPKASKRVGVEARLETGSGILCKLHKRSSERVLQPAATY